MITLYHGSNLEIETIDFSKFKPEKILGKDSISIQIMSRRVAWRQGQDEHLGQRYMSVDKLVEELRYVGSHAIQYFFANENAIKYLNRS